MSVHYDKQRKHYFFTIRVEDLNGNIKQYKERGFKSAREAKRAEAKFMLEKEDIDYENPTFEFITNDYLNWYKPRRKRSSYNKVKSIIETHLNEEFGKKRAKKIRPRDITRFQNKLLEKEYSVSHIKKIHTTLSTIFNYAIKQEYLTENVARKAGNIDAEPNKMMNFWTLDEFKQFISHVDDLMYRSLFMTLYYSGMRKGELLALTWSDVNFDAKTIRINKTSYDREITSTKTRSSTRTIMIPDFVLVLLKEIKLSKATKPDYVVFGEFYDHIATTTLDRYFAKYVKKSKVKKIRLHDFRHSHASYLINKKAIPSLVAKRLGHKDVATTLNIYSHLYPSTEENIVLDMEDDFKPTKIYQFKQ